MKLIHNKSNIAGYESDYIGEGTKMGKIVKIFVLFAFVILLIQSIVVGQEVSKQRSKQIGTYYSSLYGFRINYSGKLVERSTGEVLVMLTHLDNGRAKQSYVIVSVSQRPFVDLPGTYGGRYYFSPDSNSEFMSNRYAVEQVTVNKRIFTREYWVVYAGAGSWDTVINCYTKIGQKYYIISLVHEFVSGIPGSVINGRKVSKQEIVDKALKAMHDTNNNFVKAFNSIVSSFSIIK
jgi:hypothetical protein